ncbi:MAG: hypothetical protein PHI93_03495 [Kiritimatiellae bacterium]|nr:hypothetical protein [Kiritimatiellia bacterium]MDY0149961.1 hypothetical protein [Kiritimatiellia bacterium]
MNKYLIVVIAILLMAIATYAQTNFTETVSSLWYSGQKTNVLNIAEQRLQLNSNDIAGLILKMEYEITFLELDAVTNTMERVIQVGSSITTTNFVSVFPKLEGSINHLVEMIPLYPTNELAADQGKGDISGKPLPHTEVLQALEDDGYFD